MKSTHIQFGTDGWRALIGHEFTVENVCRIGHAVAQWLKQKGNPIVVIGFDARFGGDLFARSLSHTLLQCDVRVFMDERMVTTPMVSYATSHFGAALGIMFTASHNPPGYHGIKFKGAHGGPAFDSTVQNILQYIPEESSIPSLEQIHSLSKNDHFETVDLTQLYHEKVKARFDLNAIRKYQSDYIFDSMYGSLQNYIKELFPEMRHIRAENNPSFRGTLPEPIEKNLLPLREELKKGTYKLGLAVDGDADRIGLMDGNGNVIDAHQIMLILIWYLKKHKGFSGKVVTGFSSSQKIKKLCDIVKLDLEVVKIGFKHASQIMVTENVLLAGEEAGGIATKSHIPERDGLWNILLILEFLIEYDTTIEAVLKEIESEVGSFGYQRIDLPVDRETKENIIKQLKTRAPDHIGDKMVEKFETMDGFKFYLSDEEWLMIRPSGTEPLLRVYAESYSRKEAMFLIKTAVDQLKLH
jgi:phosphomannomutase